MKYVLRHKKNRTYYCFDKDKYRHFAVDGKKAYKFNTEKSAKKMISKMNHPSHWEVIEVREKIK